MNNHTINGELVTIHITQRNGLKHNVLVDLHIWEIIKCGTVGIMEHGNGFRARLSLNSKTMMLYQFILPKIKGKTIKHISRNPLDNRESNLGYFSVGESIPNIYKINGNSVIITYISTKHEEYNITVDLTIWQDISSYRIGIHNSGKGYYAIIYIDSKAQFLHRFIMKAADNEQVDHILDTLDNRLINLRLCTNAENSQNRHGTYSSSGERNVYWHEQSQKYVVQTQLKSKRLHLGSFDTILEAKDKAEEFRKNNMPFSQEALGEMNV